MIGYYLTHPQVRIDPAVAVPDWELSEVGRGRLAAIAARSWLRTIGRILSSDERKARETAALVAAGIGRAVEIADGMGENDRSATGFIPPDKFEAAADAFFAAPSQSWNGWETADAAQGRIVAAVDAALDGHDQQTPILFVGHGAVGTLLKCHIAGRQIARREDQPAGGGNVFAFRLHGRTLVCDWKPMERFEGVG